MATVASVHNQMISRRNLALLKRSARWLTLFLLAPAAIYTAGFFIFNPHTIGHFTNQFFLDSGDGFQNVWNVWWVDKAVTQLHQLPWWTNYLEWPNGVSLLPQTMNAFNGFMGIPLFHLFHFSLVQVVNSVVIFSFVMSGVTMFWLAYYLTRSYHGAIFAGLVFTFSSFHFAHAIGHLQLVSMEWIPLFLLAWWRLLDKPGPLIALGAAGSLGLVLLCDYYYLFYVVLAAGVIGGYRLWTERAKFAEDTVAARRLATTLGLFAALSAVEALPFVVGLWQLNRHDPLLGAHTAVDFGLDLFSPFIPGGNWYWHSLTQGFWQKLPGYYAETSVFLGVSVLTLLILALVKRRTWRLPSWLNVWWIILAIFWLFALGPRLRVWGSVPLPHVPLFYSFLGRAIPVLAISGMPIRMFVMVTVAAAIIAASVLSRLKLRTWAGAGLFVLLLAVFFFDMRPQPLPQTSPVVPEYVTVLRNLPIAKDAGIIDNAAATAQESTYYQTTHGKRLAFGFLTRTPTSAAVRDTLLFADIEQGRQAKLCSVYHIRYFATRIFYPTNFPIIYQDSATPIHIYDMKNGAGC